jgi:polysaccharide biosynthesis protein VpsM
MSIKRKITGIFVVFMAFTALTSNHAFSQGKIHLGPLRIYPLFGERIEVDDNVYQVSGKGETVRGREEKQSDLINIYAPGLKLDLPLSGGGLIPGKEHDLNLDWHSDFKNYRDHADQNQQNHYFSVSGNLRFPKGLDVSLKNKYEDTESPAGSETDQIHPRKTYLGKIEINMPDYFRKFDTEIRYSYYDQEYDERTLRNINRSEQSFTLKIPYKLAPKINIFPEYTYGFIEYDSQSGLSDPQSDSHYNEIYAGIEWYATAKSTGIIKLGFVAQDYDDTQTTDVNTFVAEVGVKVDLTRRMVLDINAGRSPRQSEFTADSNSFERNFGDFKISRRVRKDLGVSLYGYYEKQVFHDSKRKDDIYEFMVSTTYNIKKWILADFKYSYRDRHSNIDVRADRINKASFGVNFAF